MRPGASDKRQGAFSRQFASQQTAEKVRQHGDHAKEKNADLNLSHAIFDPIASGVMFRTTRALW